MQSVPDTRPSLMLRMSEADEAAWEEFVALYRPVIVRLAAMKGLQHSDAEDLAQQVLVSVSKSIGQWEHDPERARFRTWLARVVRNATLNALARQPADRGPGGTTGLVSLQHQPAAADDAALFQWQWRREAFRWIVDQIKGEFQPATWEAFWLTAVEGQSGAAAAEKTGKSLGAVYVARSRVMQRIQKKLKELAPEAAGGPLP